MYFQLLSKRAGNGSILHAKSDWGVGPNGRNFSKYFSHQCGYSAKQILSICSGHVRSFICHFYLISYFWCLIFMFSHLFILLQRLQ